MISRALHVVTIAALAAVGVRRVARPGLRGAASWRWRGLLVWEQSLVRADDLSQVKRAFDVNGWVGLLYFATTAAAVYWR